MTPTKNSEVSILQNKIGTSLDNINSAINKSLSTKEELSSLIAENQTKLSVDCELVVFGSLARSEFTRGSDIDWTLLIDGQVNTKHQELAQQVRRMIEGKFNKPSEGGAFAGLTFSHDLVHYIGGSEDSNKNMTRRILLLLESVPLLTNNNTSLVYKRVVRAVLLRYLSVISDFRKNRLPRFLVNDMIRYWRTICVDFAAKEWQQKEHKWVIRNVKLRFSRKLLFVTGMLMCLSLFNKKLPEGEAVKVLEDHVFNTPLEILASFINKYDLKEIGKTIFSSYNTFLGALSDDKTREHLEDLTPGGIESDSLFQDLREKSHEFQDALIRMFFDKDTPLKEFNRQYGVF